MLKPSKTAMQGMISGWLISLIALVVISAFTVVYLKDLNRRLFIQYQAQLQLTQQLKLAYNQLLLEQSTWSTQSRVQMIATGRLQMQIPTIQNVIVVPTHHD